MKKVFIYNKYICVRRLLDTQRINDYFLKNNCEIIDNPKNADIIIFVTCAVYNTVSKDALDKIKEFKKYKAELVVTGCLPEIEKEELSKIFKGKTISTKDLEKIDNLFPDNKIKFRSIEDTHKKFDNIDTSKINGFIKKYLEKINWLKITYLKLKKIIIKGIFNEKSSVYDYLIGNPKFFIRVGEGCFGKCSYCATKFAIGKLKSKSLTQCVDEFKEGVEKRYDYFVLTADDIGAYGLDIGSSFAELIDKITEIPNDYNISIMGLNPIWAVKYEDEIVKVLKRNNISHITLPIQSGSSRILKLMNRFSNIEKIKNTVDKIKKAYPKIKITTHIIVGFPTETWDEFIQTLNFVIEMDIQIIALNLFSCKAKTAAEKIEPKITQSDILKRVNYAKKYFKKKGYFVKYIPFAKLYFIEKKDYIK